MPLASSEAANATSVNAPYGISEWALTGLHPAPCKDVKASRVQEAIFSVEGKLVETKEFESRATPGKKTGVLLNVDWENCSTGLIFNRYWLSSKASGSGLERTHSMKTKIS